MTGARGYEKSRLQPAKKPNNSGVIQMPAVYGIIVLIVFGVVAGALYANFMSDDANDIIKSYLEGFFASFDKNSVNLKSAFINSLYKYARITAAIWISGFFSPGLVIIAGLLLFRAFAYGFTTAALVRYFGFYGFVVGFNGYIPQSLFVLPAMCFTAYNAFSRIYCKISGAGRYGREAGGSLGEYIIILLMGLLCCVCAALTETYLTPALLEFVM